jgi:hypothetical protein
MRLDDRVDTAPHTGVHEMVHAYNDVIHNWPETNGDIYDRVDEGTASFLEAFYHAMVRIADLEHAVRSQAFDGARLRRLWSAFWRQYHTIPSENWGRGALNDWSATRFWLDKSDVAMSRYLHQVSLSCERIADAFNALLVGTFFHFRCDNECHHPFYEITPGVEIDPVFR